MSALQADNFRGVRRQFLKDRWHIFALAAIVLLSFWFNFYAISKIGYGNAYYAAAIRSMMQSWHNFFYVSFDPSGLVSVDKPPLGLWVQVLFVVIFGYHGWAMLLPQALAGATSSLIMYLLTAKRFGRPAGLISALVFAVTPAVVVASRNNTMDMELVLVLLVAAWFLFRSIETGKWRWLFLCAVMIGLGFNVKMLEAYMIVPAVASTYLLCAKEKLPRRFLAGAISVVIMVTVSFAWVVAVDLTPASERPYVGSSTNNTEWELIIGHNGMERVGGGMGGGMNGNMGGNGGFQHRGQQNGAQPTQNGQSNPTPPNGGGPGTQNGQTQPNAGSPGNQSRDGGAKNNNGVMPPTNDGQRSGGIGNRGMRTGGATGNDIGTAGLSRLWQQSMFGQASWLLIPTLFCLLACIGKPQRKKLTPKQGVLLFWIVWLLVFGVFFSFASFYHRYYLCILAPGIAGLTGIGFPEMFRAFRIRNGWKRWLLPLAAFTGSGFSAWYVWIYYEALHSTLFPVIVGFGAVSLAAIAVYLIHPKKAVALAAVGLMAVSQLAGPFYWSLTAIRYVSENITMPYAGPELASTTKTPGMTANQETFVSEDSATKLLENYLAKHYKQGSYFVVGPSANDVDQFIVDTGLPAVAYGGFLGTDNALTLQQFKQLVRDGKITYVLVPTTGDRNGMGASSDILSYVTKTAKKISSSEYGGTTSFGTLYLFGSGASSSK